MRIQIQLLTLFTLALANFSLVESAFDDKGKPISEEEYMVEKATLLHETLKGYFGSPTFMRPFSNNQDTFQKLLDVCTEFLNSKYHSTKKLFEFSEKFHDCYESVKKIYDPIDLKSKGLSSGQRSEKKKLFHMTEVLYKVYLPLWDLDNQYSHLSSEANRNEELNIEETKAKKTEIERITEVSKHGQEKTCDEIFIEKGKYDDITKPGYNVGIVLKALTKCCCDILNINGVVNNVKIKNAYRKLITLLHPDKIRQAGLDEKITKEALMEVNIAKTELLNLVEKLGEETITCESTQKSEDQKKFEKDTRDESPKHPPSQAPAEPTPEKSNQAVSPKQSKASNLFGIHHVEEALDKGIEVSHPVKGS